jgi:FKBP-type peptidyl-prolyl cis-trans isomerase
MFGRRHILWSTAVAVLALSMAACSGESDSPTEPTVPPPTGPSTLQITEMTIGEGAEATSGKTVIIHYIVWRYEPSGADLKGEGLQSSYATGTPFQFVVGSNGAIVGMSQGVEGMKVGGKRRLVIPPSLAYGTAGNGTIRPNEWLVFEVELMSAA